MNHLTDNQIQDILDGNLAPSDPLMAHLDECPRCRQALENYKLLCISLGDDLAPGLSPDFANKVMAQLPPQTAPADPEGPPRFVIPDRMVVFATLAALLATAIYFLKPSVLAKLVGSWKPEINPADSQLMSRFGDFMSTLNISPGFLAMVVLTIVAIGLLDQIISHHRKRRGPVSFLV